LKRGANASANQRILSPFSILATKKNVKICLGLWILGFGVLSPIRYHCAPMLNLKRAESATSDRLWKTIRGPVLMNWLEPGPAKLA